MLNALLVGFVLRFQLVTLQDNLMTVSNGQFAAVEFLLEMTAMPSKNRSYWIFELSFPRADVQGKNAILHTPNQARCSVVFRLLF
jgi:hypothetical protein